MDSSLVRKYFFSALLFVAIGLGLLIFFPFLKIIALAAVFSVLFHPLYRVLHRWVKFPTLAAFLTLLCFVIIICIPVYFGSIVFIHQATSLYQSLITNGALVASAHQLSVWLHHVFPSVSFNLQDRATAIVASLPATAGVILTTTLASALYFIFLLISMFYFLKDGSAWKEALIELVPLSNDSNRHIIAALQRSINGIFKGYLIMGITQGLVNGLGLYLFHVPHAVLWGALSVFLIVIPPLGSGAISISAVTYLLITHHPGLAVGYAVWAIIFSTTINNVLNPYVVGKQIAIHPLLVLFSVLGGLSLMGPIGILIGPLVVSFIYALISVYKTEMGMPIMVTVTESVK